MNTKQILIIGSAVLTGLGIYFGFLHKFQDGLTGWQKITSPQLTRSEAESILGSGRFQQSWDDDFVIARAKAVKKNIESFIVRGKKYSTSTAKAI